MLPRPPGTAHRVLGRTRRPWPLLPDFVTGVWLCFASWTLSTRLRPEKNDLGKDLLVWAPAGMRRRNKSVHVLQEPAGRIWRDLWLIWKTHLNPRAGKV